jgi:hypothetical protein
MAEKAQAKPANASRGRRPTAPDGPRGLARLHVSETLAFDPIPLRSHVTLRAAPRPDARRSRMAWIATGALLLAAAWPALRLGGLFGVVVTPPAWDFFAREPAAQQVTGYVAGALFVLSLVLSLRPRWAGLHGRREIWRMVHAGLGLALCGALLVHTSARLGRGLNLVLSVAMLALLGLGAALGLIWRRVPPQPAIAGRGLRPLHLWFWWPALGLIAVHVLAIYYF